MQPCGVSCFPVWRCGSHLAPPAFARPPVIRVHVRRILRAGGCVRHRLDLSLRLGKTRRRSVLVLLFFLVAAHQISELRFAYAP